MQELGDLKHFLSSTVSQLKSVEMRFSCHATSVFIWVWSSCSLIFSRVFVRLWSTIDPCLHRTPVSIWLLSSLDLVPSGLLPFWTLLQIPSPNPQLRRPCWPKISFSLGQSVDCSPACSDQLSRTIQNVHRTDHFEFAPIVFTIPLASSLALNSMRDQNLERA